jgi:polar amino acid transport system substrate-binding protein
VEFVFLPLAEFYPALLSNTIDVLCTVLGPSNEQRERGIAFTSAFFTNSDALVVLATDTTPYTEAADFRGQPVGAVAGALGANIWTEAGVQDVRVFPFLVDAEGALRRGEINAIITAGPAVAYRQEILGLDPDLRIVETYRSILYTYPALAVRSEETDLLGRLQAALEALKADGTIATLTTGSQAQLEGSKSLKMTRASRYFSGVSLHT